MSRDYIAFDQAWKQVITDLLEFFMEFFFPEAYTQIDWSKPYEFLDKEFHELLKDAKLGRRMVDKLVRVWLKNGKQKWILLHIEVQSQKVSGFHRRLYLYNTLIFQRYKKRVVSMVIFGDENKEWRRGKFGYNTLGYRLRVNYPFVKLIDYSSKWEELEKSSNPFAVLVMAYLKTLETKGNFLSRAYWKMEIFKSLLRLKVPREIIGSTALFFDVVMALPDELERKFINQSLEYLDETDMVNIMYPYQKVFYENGKAEGWQEGMEQGMEQGVLKHSQESVLEILEERFYSVPDSLKESLENILDQNLLKLLFKMALRVNSLDEFDKAIQDSRK